MCAHCTRDAKQVRDMGAICKENLPKINLPTQEDVKLLLSKLEEMPGKPAGIFIGY